MSAHVAKLLHQIYECRWCWFNFRFEVPSGLNFRMNNNNNDKWNSSTQSTLPFRSSPIKYAMPKKEKEFARIHLNGVHSIKFMKLLINNEAKQWTKMRISCKCLPRVCGIDWTFVWADSDDELYVCTVFHMNDRKVNVQRILNDENLLVNDPSYSRFLTCQLLVGNPIWIRNCFRLITTTQQQ